VGAGAVPAASGAVRAGGSWGKAIAVPGLPAQLGTSDELSVSVSCGAAGNCAAVGYYRFHGHSQGFVATERHGRWGKAVKVPAVSARYGAGAPRCRTCSCGSAGNCAAIAGGETVAVENNGVWGKAIAIPGLAALNKGGDDQINSISCGAAGSCAAVGYYSNNRDNSEGWVATEKNSVWGNAIEPPGLAALNGDTGGGNAATNSVSCASAGNCAAVGTYGDPYGVGFEADESNGVWGTTYEAGVVGGRISGVSVVSCGSPVNCVLGGFDSDDTGGIIQVWVDEDEVPGLRALNKGGYAATDTVSCPPAGGCAAAGYYTDRHGVSQLFVVSQTG